MPFDRGALWEWPRRGSHGPPLGANPQRAPRPKGTLSRPLGASKGCPFKGVPYGIEAKGGRIGPSLEPIPKGIPGKGHPSDAPILGASGRSWALPGAPGRGALGTPGRSWPLLGIPRRSWALRGDPGRPGAFLSVPRRRRRPWALVDAPGHIQAFPGAPRRPRTPRRIKENLIWALTCIPGRASVLL